MPTGATAKQITSNQKEELLLTCQCGLALDGNSDEDDKFLSILVRHVSKHLGLIATSLLDMANINSGSTTQPVYSVCNQVREVFPLV